MANPLGPDWQQRLANIPDDEKLAAEPPVPLSLFMIVKNEEKTLGRILEAARQFTTEMVICDTGSTDRTVEIATAAGARVVHFKWCDDFAAARNFAMAQCTSEWAIWLDADDVVPEASIAAINKTRKTLLKQKEYDTVFAAYHYEYTEQGTVGVNLNRERFLRRSAGMQWIGKIHETINRPWENSVRVEEVIIEHRTDPTLMDRKKGRNIRIFEQYIDIEKDSLRELFLYGSELQAVNRNDDAIKVFKKYLERAGDTMDGVGERYSVLMKLADTHYVNKQPFQAIQFCAECIKLDPNRAEGYTIMGAILHFANFFTQSTPLLAAATFCTIPPPNISLVVQKLYYDLPMQLIVDAAVKQRSTHALDRFLHTAEALKRILPEIQKQIAENKNPVPQPGFPQP